MNKNEITKLKRWFINQCRDLPWRNHPSPYAVWVSEVMLQQTQVAVVIPYFERWMQRYPSIQHLAAAPQEEVLKMWEGLGYYSRARNLHAGAQYVVEHHAGILPNTAEQLSHIKGLGTYTIGAILSFAFHQRMAAVDGNVLRVLTRYYGICDDIVKSATLKKIHTLATDLLPEKEPWIVSEALIELGATVCARQPKCLQCPLNNSCQAFLEGKTEQIPVKAAKVAITPLYRSVAVVSHHNCLLIKRGAKGKIMADLCEFPYVELTQPDAQSEILQTYMEKAWKLTIEWQQALPPVKHSFTRYRALLLPHIFSSQTAEAVSDYEWVDIETLKRLPFSSGHRRVFEMVLNPRLNLESTL